MLLLLLLAENEISKREYLSMGQSYSWAAGSPCVWFSIAVGWIIDFLLKISVLTPNFSKYNGSWYGSMQKLLLLNAEGICFIPIIHDGIPLSLGVMDLRYVGWRIWGRSSFWEPSSSVHYSCWASVAEYMLKMHIFTIFLILSKFSFTWEAIISSTGHFNFTGALKKDL